MSEENLNPFAGAKVFVSEYLPVRISPITLSEEVNVSDSFRLGFDQWLKDRFGRDQHMFTSNGNIFCSAEMYERIKKQGEGRT